MNIARPCSPLSRRLLSIALMLAVVAGALVPSSSAQEAGVETMAIIQGVPGRSLDISSDAIGSLTDLGFLRQIFVPRTGELSGLTIVDSDTDQIVFGPVDLALPPLGLIDVIAHPAPGGGVTVSVVQWDLAPAANGDGRLLVGHGIDLPTTDVTIDGTDGYSTTTRLSNGQSIGLDLPPGDYTVGFTLPDGEVRTWITTVGENFMSMAWITGLSENGLTAVPSGHPLAVAPAPEVHSVPLASAHSLRATNAVFFAPVFAEPGGESFTLLYEYLDGETIEYPLVNPTYFDNDLVLAVTQGVPGDEWAEVLLPVRPQGTTGWIRTADFEWVFHDKTVHLFIEDSTVMVANGLGPIWEFPAEVGRLDRPTPPGKTYIDEIVPAPSPSFGTFIVSLAMYSESINTFSGGLPKISINGTMFPHEAGTAGTSGSFVMRNAEVEFLIDLLGPNAAGTPLTIWSSRAAFDASFESRRCGGRAPTVDLALGQTPTAGDDVIVGTPGDDVIVAGSGNDVICGLGGNDRIWGQDGNDFIYAGDGDDKVRGGDGNDTIYGDAGTDDLNGGRNNDVVRGGAGDDIAIRGGTGDDVVMGDAGNDVLVAGNGGSDMVIGGAGADKVTGGPRPDTVAGGAGNDDVKGNKGADLLFGEDGDDELFGGPQPDLLDGGFGNDTCNGGTEVDEATAGRCETLIAVP